MDSTNNNSQKPSPERQMDNGQTCLIQSNDSSPSPEIVKRKMSKAAPAAPQPPDGGWGWAVVFACFVGCAGVVGLTRAFGIIYVEILQAFPESSDLAVSWIPGLYNTLSTGFAPIAGALSNKYSCRSVVFFGGLLMSFGLILNFFANSVEYLYVSFGIITGCGAGLCTTPGIMMVAKYFKKRRALANGLCLAGTSSGAFVQPLIVEWLTNVYGFRGAMLIMGGFILHISAFALLYRPLEPPAPKPPKTTTRRSSSCAKKYFSFITCFLDKNVYKQQTSHDSSPESKIMLKESSPFPNAIELISAKGTPTPSPERDVEHEGSPASVDEDTLEEMYRRQSVCLHHSVNDLTAISTVQENIPEKKKGATGLKKYLDYTLFWNRAYILFWLSSFFTAIGYPHASVFMPAYAKNNLGIPKEKTSFLLSITAGTDLVGRIGIGYLADLNLFKKTHAYMAAVAMTATATLLLPVMVDFKDLGINSGFYGFGVGSFFMLTPVILTDHHGADKVASSYGLVRLSHGIASLICPPIAGSLADLTGTYTPGFIFMGICMMLGSVIVLFIPRALEYERKKEAQRRGSSVTGVGYQPVGEMRNIPDDRRASHSSLQSWGRRFSVDPDV